MKIALAQIVPRLGDVKANVELHLDVLEKSRRGKADLVVFPELGLTGYTLKDLVEEGIAVLQRDEDLTAFGELLHDGWEAKRSLSASVSSPEIDEGEAWVLEAIMACYCTRHRQD